MLTYKLLAALLDYPGSEIVDDLRSAVAEEGGALGLLRSVDTDEVFSEAEHIGIAGFIDWMLAQEQTELEGGYVKTFDLTPEHSLHLTHHVFGDDKNRGPALIDLSEFYKSYGLQHDEREIPDYLPMMLEFVSTRTDRGARVPDRCGEGVQRARDQSGESAEPLCGARSRDRKPQLAGAPGRLRRR